jgi:hypothetical protein
MKKLSVTQNALESMPDDPWQWPEFDIDAVETDYTFIDRLIALGDRGPESPLFQYFAVLDCRRLQPMIESGDGFATLAAVRKCGTAGLKMPLWLVYAFNRKYDAVLNFQAVSWDAPESFGKPYPKGIVRAAKRKKRVLSVAVLNAVRLEKQTTGAAIDKALFEKVGDPLGLGVTLADEYYQYAKKLLMHITDAGVLQPATSPKTPGIKKKHQ